MKLGPSFVSVIFSPPLSRVACPLHAFSRRCALIYCRAVVPSTRVVALKGKELQYGFQNFVASTGSVVGDVKIGELTSVWYGAVVRGE